jgi:hypothetical protein
VEIASVTQLNAIKENTVRATLKTHEIPGQVLIGSAINQENRDVINYISLIFI